MEIDPKETFIAWLGATGALIVGLDVSPHDLDAVGTCAGYGLIAAVIVALLLAQRSRRGGR